MKGILLPVIIFMSLYCAQAHVAGVTNLISKKMSRFGGRR